MILNESKTKEMLIHFGKTKADDKVQPVKLNNVPIERVTSYKLLGVMFQNNLSWDAHVQFILTKVNKRFYCIRSLLHAKVVQSDAIIIYCSVIRSVLEYACPVWHPGLTRKQDKDIERVQKRALKLIFSIRRETITRLDKCSKK